MARVEFAKAFHRHVECPAAEASGATVAAVLDAYFQDRPGVQGYVLDEHGSVRRHVTVFLNGNQIVDRTRLTDPVGPQDAIWVFQALSGG
jgi:molybdopterin synthase sulfur carrier subunit